MTYPTISNSNYETARTVGELYLSQCPHCFAEILCQWYEYETDDGETGECGGLAESALTEHYTDEHGKCVDRVRVTK